LEGSSKIRRKIQASLNSEKKASNLHENLYIYDNISLICTQNYKCFRQNL